MDDTRIKIACSEILKGFSIINSNTFGKIYVRHFGAIDTCSLDIHREELIQEAESQGLLSTEKKLELLKEIEAWSDKQEDELISLEGYLSNLRRTKDKQVISKQIEAYKKQIEETEKKVLKIKIERLGLLGVTSDNYADTRLNELYVFHSLYKDENLKEKFFTEKEFFDIENKEIQSIIDLYNQSLLKFKEKEIKKVALYPFYYNLFSLCGDDAYKMYGKPILELTFYQTETFRHALYFKKIFTNSEVQPPDDVVNDPDKLVEWFTQSNNAKELVQGKEGKHVSVVGMTAQDYEKTGVVNNSAEVVDLFKKAQESGGELGMEHFIKMYNQ